MRSWLEIPLSGTLKITTLSKCNFGLNFTSVSSRFTQCQFTFRKALKTSKNNNIKKIHKDTQTGSNIQSDSYLSTRDAIKKIREKTQSEITDKLDQYGTKAV